ncbi:hypothetical protein DFP72DRAFT_1040472 [Ephemerocybe angulata]|uniref:Fungal-type protein kinase domain-containing protein n=1 Tax=Ephemerocybe angulata TaxID=980116 RepID=A0A8H6IET2_9AGAR|nr:hypothetical protein DFP72DRAFT_1040472 [Tulosesus angulatus]
MGSGSLPTVKRRRNSHSKTHSEKAIWELELKEARQIWHLDNAFNHLLELPVDAWFKSCAGVSDLWAKERVSTILHLLTERGVLLHGKWDAMVLQLASSSYDDVACQIVERLAIDVQGVVDQLDEELGATPVYRSNRTSSVEATVCGTLRSKPNGHETVASHLTAVDDPNPRPKRDLAWKKRRKGGVHITSFSADIAALAEFKDCEVERFENERQLLANVAHLMYDDPRRIFVFGITFEETWEPKDLIRALLFLSCASREQLGLDPTVVQGMEANERCFRYAVGDKSYRTLGDPLEDSGAFYLIGRGVRVWTVRQCDENGEFLSDEHNVLKDTWQWDENPTERQIQGDILQSLADKSNISLVDAQAKLSKYFLTIVADQTLTSTLRRPSEAQETFFTERPVNPIPGASRPRRSSQLAGSDTPTTRTVAPPLQIELDHQTRTNQRHVFKEKCITFDEVCDLRASLEVCKGYVAALSLFREAGYVHRGISRGNCLVYENHGRLLPKISDLEHCKRYDSVSTHDEVTVTFQFTAVEIGLRKTCFPLDMADFPSFKAYLKAKTNRPHHHFHFLHDLESVFWVASHHIVNSIPENPRNIPTVDSVKAWHATVKRYFDDTTDSIVRRQVLLQQNLDELHTELEQWWTAEFTDIFLQIFVFARDLIAQYKALQKQPQVSLTHDASDRRWPEDLLTSDAYDIWQVYWEVLEMRYIPCKTYCFWDMFGMKRGYRMRNGTYWANVNGTLPEIDSLDTSK